MLEGTIGQLLTSSALAFKGQSFSLMGMPGTARLRAIRFRAMTRSIAPFSIRNSVLVPSSGRIAHAVFVSWDSAVAVLLATTNAYSRKPVNQKGQRASK